MNRIAARVQLIRPTRLDTAAVRATPRGSATEYARMHGTPYIMRRNMVIATNGLPCTPPPWGSLVGIDLNTGAKAWDVPLGDPLALSSDLARLPTPPAGTPNLGGPIVTASGLAFIGAALDHALRAFDVRTGRELWKARCRAARARLR